MSDIAKIDFDGGSDGASEGSVVQEMKEEGGGEVGGDVGGGGGGDAGDSGEAAGADSGGEDKNNSTEEGASTLGAGALGAGALGAGASGSLALPSMHRPPHSPPIYTPRYTKKVNASTNTNSFMSSPSSFIDYKRYNSEAINTMVTSDTNLFSCCNYKSFQSKFYKRVFDPLKELYKNDKITKEQFRMIYQHIIKRGMLSEMNAIWYRRWATRIDIMSLYGGIFVSGLVVVQQSIQVHKAGIEDILYWLLVVLSVTVNLAVGTQQLQNFPELARIYESLSQDIESIFWSYLTLSNEFSGRVHNENTYSEIMGYINTIQKRADKNIQRALNKTQDQETNTHRDVHEIIEQLQDVERGEGRGGGGGGGGSWGGGKHRYKK
jgi:hypothetical protein